MDEKSEVPGSEAGPTIEFSPLHEQVMPDDGSSISSSSATTSFDLHVIQSAPKNLEDLVFDENGPLRRHFMEDGRGLSERLDNQTNLMAKIHGALRDSQKKISQMEAAERSLNNIGTGSFSNLSPQKLGVYKTSTPLKSNDTSDDFMMNRLLKEQDRNATLNDTNFILRRELDEAKLTTVSLTGDLLRLTQEFDKSRRDLRILEEECKKKEKLHMEQLTSEHHKMLQLWRSFQQLRRDYVDCRSTTRRDLNVMESDFQRFSKGTTAACQKMGLWLTYLESSRVLTNATDVHDSGLLNLETGVEEIILDNVRRLTESQTEKEERIKQMQQKLDELLEQNQLLESQVLERERQLEIFKNEEQSLKNKEDDKFAQYLNNALRDLMDRFSDENNAHMDDSLSIVSPRRRTRSHSPTCGYRGKADIEYTIKLIKETLDKRRKENKETASQLRTLQSRFSELDKFNTTNVEHVERLGKELFEANSKIDVIQKERDDAVMEKENMKSQLAIAKNEILVGRKKLESAEKHGEILRKDLDNANGRVLQLELRLSNAEEDCNLKVDDVVRRKSEISKLRHLLDSTQSALTESREDATNAQAINNRLERKIRDLESEEENSKEELKKLETKFNITCSNLDEAIAKERVAKERCDILEKENVALVGRYEEVMRNCQMLEKRVEKLEQEYTECRKKKDATENEIQCLNEEVEDFKHMETVWNQERAYVSNQLEARDTNLREFEKCFETLKAEHLETDAQFKNALEKQHELESQLETCRQNLNDEREKLSKVFEDRDHLENDRDELDNRIVLLTNEIQRLQVQEKQKQEKYRKRVQELEWKLERADEQSKTLENLNVDLNRRIEDANEEKRNEEKRAVSLRTVLLSQEEIIRVKETEKRNAQNRLAQLEIQLRGRATQLKQLNEKLEKSNIDLEKANTEKQTLKTEFDKVLEDNQRYHLDLANASKEVHQLRLELQEAVCKAEATNEKANNLEIKWKHAEEVKMKLESELSNLNSTVIRVRENGNALQMQLDNSQDLISKYLEEIQVLRDQLLSGQQALRTVEQEKRMVEERFHDVREQLTKTKSDGKLSLNEKSILEEKYLETERQLVDTESKLKIMQKMLFMSQETETDLKRQLENAVGQKRDMVARIDQMQRKIEASEIQERNDEAMRNQLDQELEKLRNQLILYEDESKKNEIALRLAVKEREAMDLAMNAMEEQNAQLQNTVMQLQNQLTKMENTQSQKLMELQRSQTEFLTLQDELRKAQFLEEEYSRKIKSQEEQIKRLKEELDHQIKSRRDYVQRYMRSTQGTAELRLGLDDSITSLKNDPTFVPLPSPIGSPKHSSTPVKRGGMSNGSVSFNNTASTKVLFRN